MKKPILFLLPCVLLFTACSLLDSNKDPERPDIPGKIVFSAKDEDGTSQIYTMNANGSDLKKLTSFSQSGEAVQPSWHPSGQQILFSSFEQGTSVGPALWVMDSDGSNQHVLYDSDPDNPDQFPLLGNHARWSPDGRKVAFDLCLNCQIATNYDIYIFDTTTQELTQLTDHPGSDTNPTWSPDGTKIAFVSDRDYYDADTLRFRQDIYAINIDGTNLKRLTDYGYLGGLDWIGNNRLAISYLYPQTKLMDLFIKNTTEGSEQLITDNLAIGSLYIFGDTNKQQIITIHNERSESEPIIFTRYSETGAVINQVSMKNSEEFVDAKNFDWKEKEIEIDQ